MEISVIIPTFNRASFICRAIDSVLNQSTKVQEIIIVDDGSTDNTKDLLNVYIKDNSNIKYLQIKNSGVSNARNIGVKSASSEWISFLDSDDEWLPSKIEKQINYLNRMSNVDFVYTDENWYRNAKFVNKKKYQKKIGGNIFSSCLEDCFIGVSSVLMKKELFLSNGGFDRKFEVCEDFALWLKITQSNYIGLVEEPLVNKFAGHGDQLSMKYSIMDYWRIIALNDILLLRKVSPQENQQVTEMIKKKSQILLPGLEKLGLNDHYHQIIELLEQV